MSLATRCTHCGTIFKVVQDQLKVSEGWVRCGRCQQVFNALEGLFDLERDPPPQRRVPAGSTPASATTAGGGAGPRSGHPGAPHGATSEGPTSPPSPPAFARPGGLPRSPVDSPRAEIPAPLAEPTAPASESVPDTYEDDALDSRWLMRPARDEKLVRQRMRRSARGEDFEDAQFPQDAWEDELDPEWAAAEAALAASASGDDPEPPLPASPPAPAPAPAEARLRKKLPATRPEDTPEFIRRAERRARWQRPGVRITLAFAALALAALLALQGGYHFRDALAARVPGFTPALSALCDAAGCDLRPPMQIEDLVVDSATLTRAAARPSPAASPAASDADLTAPAAGQPLDYRLDLTLRNRARWALAVPHVELTLTDTEGAVVSRRTLALDELGFRDEAVPAESTTALRLGLTSQVRIAGYTVEIFYP